MMVTAYVIVSGLALFDFSQAGNGTVRALISNGHGNAAHVAHQATVNWNAIPADTVLDINISVPCPGASCKGIATPEHLLNLKDLVPSATLRTECKTTAQACKTGRAALLSGVVTLEGPWVAEAMFSCGFFAERRTAAEMHLMNFEVGGRWRFPQPVVLGNSVVFSARAEDREAIGISGGNLWWMSAQECGELAAKLGWDAPEAGECGFLVVDNAGPSPGALNVGDPHFDPLYTLLSSYPGPDALWAPRKIGGGSCPTIQCCGLKMCSNGYVE